MVPRSGSVGFCSVVELEGFLGIVRQPQLAQTNQALGISEKQGILSEKKRWSRCVGSTFRCVRLKVNTRWREEDADDSDRLFEPIIGGFTEG